MKEIFGRLNLGEHDVAAHVVVPHAMNLDEVKQRARQAFDSAREDIETASMRGAGIGRHEVATGSGGA